MRSVKTTAYDQNNKIKWNFHIFKAQKSSKSGQTVQGIVQSVSESLSMKWNRRFRGLTMFVFNFGVGSLEQSVKLGRLVIFDFLGNSLLWTPLFPNRQPNSSAFYSVFVVWAVFQLRWRKKTYLKRRPLLRSQIFKFCCDIQGSHLIGYLWVSLIIDQPECLVCYFLCTELTLFCIELPENCIYLNQSELSNFFYVYYYKRN